MFRLIGGLAGQKALNGSAFSSQGKYYMVLPPNRRGRGVRWISVLLAGVISGGCAAHKTFASEVKPGVQPEVVFGTLNKTSVLHNPAMGWVYYDPGIRHRSISFWKSRAAELKFCNTVYWRGPWSDFEPQRGKYAWQYNKTVIQWLHRVKAMHLRLAFRVIVNSKDFSKPATPLWVKKDGARGYLVDGLWTPYPDDPIFQSDFSRFLRAFGKRFDNPNDTAYVDASGLGWWGEMSHLHIPASHNAQVFNWLCSSYAKAFPHVLLVTNMDAGFGLKLDKEVALGHYGIMFRRDGIGSPWFYRDEERFMQKIFPRSPLFAELCYGNPGPGKPIAPTKLVQLWLKNRGVSNFHEYMKFSVRQALQYHANVLNLPGGAWQQVGSKLAYKFARHCGYRLCPLAITYPAAMTVGRPYAIKALWINGGVGVLPNAAPQWGHKYKFAFALFNGGGTQPDEVSVDQSRSKLSTLVYGQPQVHTNTVRWHVPAGQYRLAVAIVNTAEHNRAAIELAVSNLPRVGRWYVVGRTTIVANR